MVWRLWRVESLTDDTMAARLLLLLLALCSNIHAELLLRAGWSHDFDLQSGADFCSVSRWSAEGQQLLWNASGSYYKIDLLDASHSGRYQVRCWTRGNVTLHRNSTFLVCDMQRMSTKTLYPNVGETVELDCEGAGPTQSLQWAYESFSTHEFFIVDHETPSLYEHRLLKSKPALVFRAERRPAIVSYYCLERRQLRCDVRRHFFVNVPSEFILRSVGESLELNCSRPSSSRAPAWWVTDSRGTRRVSLNFTLSFPSLAPSHSGRYGCDGSSAAKYYLLYVCPEPGPPAVQLFTAGENLTLHCGARDPTGDVSWFMRSNRTGGRVLNVDEYQQPDNMHLSNGSLEIRNVSLQDSGHFWCVVRRGFLCDFRSETLVKLSEPGVDHLLLRSVLLSAVVLMMLCVVGGVVWRSRRGAQVPAPAEEQEMSQLSPESDVQEEAPV